eukprot:252634-Alexandrium_andersonii.AAC.1
MSQLDLSMWARTLRSLSMSSASFPASPKSMSFLVTGMLFQQMSLPGFAGIPSGRHRPHGSRG